MYQINREAWRLCPTECSKPIVIAKTRQELEFYLKQENILYFGKLQDSAIYTKEGKQPEYKEAIYLIVPCDIIILD